MPDTTTYTKCMPENPKPTKLSYMPGICKGPSDLTWLYRLPKNWHVWGIHLGTKATNSYESSKSWCTSGI